VYTHDNTVVEFNILNLLRVVIGVESEGGDCDEVICAGCGEPGGQ